MRFLEHHQRQNGFSLIELLITLVIMGIIATFTVPSLLNSPNSSKSSKYNAIASDAAYMVLSAYRQYKLANGTVATTVTGGELTPYMNYVTKDTSTIIDADYGYGTMTCSTSYNCLKLHNGGMLMTSITGYDHFGGTNTTNVIWFMFDPDGVKTDNTTNGPGKTLTFFLTYDGKIYGHGHLPATVYYTTGGNVVWSYANCPSCEPPWFTGF